MNKKLTARTVNALLATGKRYRVWDTEIKGFHVRVTPAGKKLYVFTYRHNGVLTEYSIGLNGTITADIARDQAIIKAGEVTGGKDVPEEKVEAKKTAKTNRHATLGKFITNKYQPWVEANQKGHKEALRTLNTDFSHLHSRRMADITQWDIQKWMADKQKAKLEPTTINRRVATLKAVLTKAVEWAVIKSSPLAGMKRLKTDSAPNVRYLSKGEEKALRSTLEVRQESQRTDRQNYIDWRNARHLAPPKSLKDTYTDYLMPMVVLAINTGVRRGELFSLKWSDVDLKGRLLTIAGKTAKSGSTRHIPLNDEAFAVLVAWSNQSKDNGKESGLVFPSPVTGERMDNITSSWKNLLKDSEIKNFRFHDLRHHFASRLVMGGVDLNTVRELLGHQDIETTLRYAHLAPEHKAAAVALLNQLGNK